MAPAIVHFLAGASLWLLLAAPLARRYDLAWPWPLWLVAIGGVWGLAPDAHHVAPGFESRLRAVHGTSWTDVFAFHYALDRPAVRARSVEATFGAIWGFLGAVGAFTIAGRAGAESTEPGSGPAAGAPAVALGLSALLVGIALGGLGYAALG